MIEGGQTWKITFHNLSQLKTNPELCSNCPLKPVCDVPGAESDSKEAVLQIIKNKLSQTLTNLAGKLIKIFNNKFCFPISIRNLAECQKDLRRKDDYTAELLNSPFRLDTNGIQSWWVDRD